MTAIITETDRLIIRELATSDADFIVELVNDPLFMTNIADKQIHSRADAERFIREGPWTNQSKPGYGQFAVVLKGTAEPVGICGLLFRETLSLTDIGFAMLPRYRGRGIAFEAADAVLQYGKSTLSIDRIVGLTSEDNVASIRVLQKLGMRFESRASISDDGSAVLVYS